MKKKELIEWIKQELDKNPPPSYTNRGEVIKTMNTLVRKNTLREVLAKLEDFEIPFSWKKSADSVDSTNKNNIECFIGSPEDNGIEEYHGK